MCTVSVINKTQMSCSKKGFCPEECFCSSENTFFFFFCTLLSLVCALIGFGCIIVISNETLWIQPFASTCVE